MSQILNCENAKEPDIYTLVEKDAHGVGSITITEQDALDQLSTMDVNKAYGPDETPPKLLKEAAREITHSITKLLNASLNLETFLSS